MCIVRLRDMRDSEGNNIKSIFKLIAKNNIEDMATVFISNEKKKTRNRADKEAYRGSQFRGVSINGVKWQVFIIIKNKKYYVGQMDTEAEAARLYDKLILLHSGLSAKTNFSYTAQQIKEIFEANNGPSFMVAHPINEGKKNND